MLRLIPKLLEAFLIKIKGMQNLQWICIKYLDVKDYLNKSFAGNIHT